MHQAAFPGEDISDRPEPENVAPVFVALITSGLPSGRYLADDLRHRPGRVPHERHRTPRDAGHPFRPTGRPHRHRAPERRGLRRDGVRLLVAESDASSTPGSTRSGTTFTPVMCWWSTPRPRCPASSTVPRRSAGGGPCGQPARRRHPGGRAPQRHRTPAAPSSMAAPEERIDCPPGIGDCSPAGPDPARPRPAKGNRLWRGPAPDAHPSRLWSISSCTPGRSATATCASRFFLIAATRRSSLLPPGSAEMPSAATTVQYRAGGPAGGRRRDLRTRSPCTPACPPRRRTRGRRPSGSRSAGPRRTWSTQPGSEAGG